VLGDNVAERRRHGGEAFDRFLRDVGEQLILKGQRSRGRFRKQLLDDRAGRAGRAIRNFENAVDEFSIGIRAVDGRSNVQRRGQDLSRLPRRGRALHLPLFGDAVAARLGHAAHDEFLPHRLTLVLDAKPHASAPMLPPHDARNLRAIKPVTMRNGSIRTNKEQVEICASPFAAAKRGARGVAGVGGHNFRLARIRISALTFTVPPKRAALAGRGLPL
jgi:hypothetical protein